MGLQKDEKLNLLLERLPEGVAASSRWLADQGYSRQLVRKYVQGNWLQALGRGVYARPQGSVTWEGMVLGMQRLARLQFHVGGVSALNRQGFVHYLPLGGENTLHLWGRDKVPAWVRAVSLPESLRFHTARLFADDVASVGINAVSSSVRDWALQVSAPERAILELLSLVDTTDTSFAHAAELFAGLTSLRPDVINALLGACVSIKVKRLFLFLADRHDYPWFSKVGWRQLDLGSGKRAITKGGVLDKQFMITVPERYRDTPYFRQVALIIDLLPLIGEGTCFALKGGTAINLFLRDLPRLSVDIDLTWLQWETRNDALTNIGASLEHVAGRIEETML